MAGVDILHVPYKTEMAGRMDLVGGRTDMMITAYGAALPNLKQSQLRVLAVTSTARFAELPDVPTLSEAGVPGYEGDAWIGLLAPAKTRAAVITRIRDEVAGALNAREFRAKLASQGITPLEDAPGPFAQFLRADVEKWRKIIQVSGAKVD